MQTTARRLVFDGSCAGSATDEVAVLPPAASTHSVAPPQQAWAPCTTDDLDTGGCVTPSVETNARESADKPAYGADSGATSVPAPGSSADLQPSSLPSSDMQATKDSDPPSAAARRPPRPIPQALLGLPRPVLAAALKQQQQQRNASPDVASVAGVAAATSSGAERQTRTAQRQWLEQAKLQGVQQAISRLEALEIS